MLLVKRLIGGFMLLIKRQLNRKIVKHLFSPRPASAPNQRHTALVPVVYKNAVAKSDSTVQFALVPPPISNNEMDAPTDF
jgi:hypothetical protein